MEKITIGMVRDFNTMLQYAILETVTVDPVWREGLNKKKEALTQAVSNESNVPLEDIPHLTDDVILNFRSNQLFREVVRWSNQNEIVRMNTKELSRLLGL